ncbi:energy transducer TonB [Desulfobacter latus]|uniref:Energy transducer TonB n=1 Tax=Desulfobacter latus TaxID=2292 RepID=A0A850T5L9_9BACT|nr:energy transducer TonB [Desulfobacter latus]NWH03608.1 energy transducer TonB [Desulfobacter latus]
MKTVAHPLGLNSTWRSWAVALAGTLALNLLLFSVIPNLMKPREVIPQMGPMIQQIQLTRLRRSTIEPEKKESPPPPKAQPQKQPVTPRINRQINPSLSMPFEINPRLPQGPAAIAVPDVMSTSLDTLSLDTLFDTGDLDQPLTVISRVPPVYPFRAKAKAIEGWVSVAFTVNEQGRVEDIKILDAEPENIFDDSVMQCVAAWRFKPGRVNQELVKTRARTRIRFKLN